MTYNNERLNDIFDRTFGRCHLCGKSLTFANYGLVGAIGAWEAEHSVPRAHGGTNRLNNLYAACISCNRSKGTTSTRIVRRLNGLTRAPLSSVERIDTRMWNAIGCGGLGAGIGVFIGGRKGAVVGIVIGALLGLASETE